MRTRRQGVHPQDLSVPIFYVLALSLSLYQHPSICILCSSGFTSYNKQRVLSYQMARTSITKQARALRKASEGVQGQGKSTKATDSILRLVLLLVKTVSTLSAARLFPSTQLSLPPASAGLTCLSALSTRFAPQLFLLHTSARLKCLHCSCSNLLDLLHILFVSFVACPRQLVKPQRPRMSGRSCWPQIDERVTKVKKDGDKRKAVHSDLNLEHVGFSTNIFLINL